MIVLAAQCQPRHRPVVVSSLPVTPSNEATSPGWYGRPSRLSKDRFSNITDTNTEPGAGIMDDMLTTEYDGCGRCLVAVRRLSRKTERPQQHYLHRTP